LAQAAKAVAPLVVGLAKLVELVSQNKFLASALGLALVAAFASPKVNAGYAAFQTFGAKAVGHLSKIGMYAKLAVGQFGALRASGVGAFAALGNTSGALLSSITGISTGALAAGASFGPLLAALAWLQYEGAKNAEDLRLKVEETNESFESQIDLLMKNKQAMLELKDVAAPTMSVIEGTGDAAIELRDAFKGMGTEFNYPDLLAAKHDFELFSEEILRSEGITGAFADQLIAVAESCCRQETL
jgi:hypothetical protein